MFCLNIIMEINKMFTINDNGTLPSLADLIPHTPNKEITPAVLEDSAKIINSADLPLQSTMGVMDDLSGLIRRLWFRKLVRELPEETRSMPWFECHVPPGGKTSVQYQTTRERSAEVGIKVYGSGFGHGRSAIITVSSSSESRSSCATFSLDLRIKPRLYESMGQESLELEVLEILGESHETHKTCPYCGVKAESVDKFEFTFGPHIDLKNDTVKMKRTFSVQIDTATSFSVGISIPKIPVELNLEGSVTKGTVLNVESEFLPGFMYLPYHRASRTPIQTEMWAIRK